MALQIPIYDSQQVQAAPIPGPQAQQTQSGLGALGEGLKQAGSVFGELALQAKNLADKQVVSEGVFSLQAQLNQQAEDRNRIVGAAIKDPKAWNGQDGQSYSEHSRVVTADAVKDITANMTAAQRQMFDQHATPMLLAAQHQTNQHEYAQIFNVQVQTADALIAQKIPTGRNSVVDGKLNFDSFLIAQQGLEAAIDAKASLVKATPEVVEVEKKRLLGEMVAETANALLGKSNSGDALKLVHSYQDLIDPKTFDHFAEKARVANDLQRVDDNAAGALAAATNQATRTIDLEEGRRRLEADLPGPENALVRKEAMEAFKVRASERQNVWAQQDDATLQPTFKLLRDGKTPLSTLLKQVNAAPISEKAKTEASHAFHTWFANRRSEAIQAANPIYSQQQLAEQYAEMDKLLRDPKFATMTTPQILEKRAALGLKNTEHLIDTLREVQTNPKKLQKINLDDDLMNMALHETKVFTSDKPSPADLLKGSFIKAQAKIIMQASGVDWPYDKQRDLIKGLSEDVTTSTHWWRPNSTEAFYQLRPKTQIPDAFITRTNATLAAKGGGQLSEVQMMKAWFKARDKGLVDEKGNPTK